MTNHLDNVCIMQKYNDSEKVLELREQFKESEAFIKKAVNEYDDNKALIAKFEKTLASDSIRLAKMSIINDELVEALKYALEMAKQGAIPNYDDSWYIEAEEALEKASQ